MKNDVILSITGLHINELLTDEEGIEVISPGKYYNKNGKHYVLFDEVIPETKEVVNNRLKIEPNKVEISKGGGLNTKLTFEKDRISVSQYHTPYGDITIGTTTRQLNISEEEETIKVTIAYALEINNEWASDCTITIVIKNMNKKGRE